MDHFYGHAQVSAAIAKERLQALKADRYTIDTVTRLVSLHDVSLPPTRPVVRRWLGRLGEDNFRRLLAVKQADFSAQAPTVQQQRQQEWQQLATVLEEVCAQSLCFSRQQLAVTGRDLIAIGIPSGKHMGRILQALLNEVIAERLPNQRDVLLQWVQKQTDIL